MQTIARDVRPVEAFRWLRECPHEFGSRDGLREFGSCVFCDAPNPRYQRPMLSVLPDDDFPPHGAMVCLDHGMRLEPITALWNEGDTLESRYAKRQADTFICPEPGCDVAVLWPPTTAEMEAKA